MKRLSRVMGLLPAALLLAIAAFPHPASYAADTPPTGTIVINY